MPAHHRAPKHARQPHPDLRQQVSAWIRANGYDHPCQGCGCDGRLFRGLCADCRGERMEHYSPGPVA